MADSEQKKDTSMFPKIDKANMADWLWTDFVLALSENAKLNGKSDDDVAFFPKVVYLYKALQKYIKNSSYDGDTYGFPFIDDELDACNGIQFSGLYGENRGDHIHRGIDLATGAGNKPNFHSIADGTCIAAGDGWGSACNAVIIQHTDGTYARYLHCDSIAVSNGASVARGDVLGTVGGYGGSGPSTYPLHLHLEFGHGDGASAVSDTDPMTLFNAPGISHNKCFYSDGIR